MFDSELIKISEKTMRKLDLEAIKRKNQETEKKVLEIIKQRSAFVNEYGIVRIFASSYEHIDWYDTLSHIITTGQLKYYEEEYSLYLENIGPRPWQLSFYWDSIEYYRKNAIQNDSLPKL